MRTKQEEIERLQRMLENAEQVRDSNLKLAIWASRKSDEMEQERNNYRAAHSEALRILDKWQRKHPVDVREIEEDRFGGPEYHLRYYSWPRGPEL